VPLTLKASAAIPATYPLVISFAARFRGESTWEHAITQGKVTIGVPGVSDAMQFLGIPSLLLLPGALMILTFITVLPRFTLRPPIDWKNPSLLVAAVLLSFAAGYLYPCVTKYWLGTERNYLRGYDMSDVGYLWIGSIAIAAVVAAAAGVVTLAARASYRWWKSFNEPQENDLALATLKKLQSHGAPFKLAAVSKRPAANAPAAAAPPQTMLVLPFGEVKPGQRWVVQQAVFHRIAGAPGAANRAQAITQILEEIDNDTPGAVGRLLKQIEQGLHGDIIFEWEDDQDLGPRLVIDGEYQSAGVPLRFVRDGDA
jgi:hypothetical protein